MATPASKRRTGASASTARARPTRPREKVLPLPGQEPESWGERVSRAYRAQRRRTGQHYREVAERISQIHPVLNSQLSRLEDNEDLPPTRNTRLIAFLALIAYGYDPEDFGLNAGNTPVAGYDLKRVVDLLKPESRCTPLSAA